MIYKTQYNQSDLIEILSYVDSRPPHDEWVNIISAVANHINNDAIAEQILLSHFREEKPGEIAYKIKHRTSKHNIGYLIGKHAKPGGFKFDNTENQQHNFNYKKQVVEKKKYVLPEKKRLIYRFYDKNAIECFNGILKETGNRLTASQKTVDTFPNAKKDREYTFCINRKIVNKNCCAKIFKETNQLIELSYHTTLNDNFEPIRVIESDIPEIIKNGYAMIFSEMEVESDKYFINGRSIDKFICAELIAIDIDNKVPLLDDAGNKVKDANNRVVYRRKTIDEGYLTFDDAISMELTQQAICVYTTPTHTPEHHKFRIIFDFDEIIFNAELVKDVIKSIGEKYGGDENATSIVNIFYGNVNAKIYIPKTTELIEYKNGVELCQ